MSEHTTGELRIGMRVRLRAANPALDQRVLTVIEQNHVTGRVKVRHEPPPGGKGYAYLFWYALDELEGAGDG